MEAERREHAESMVTVAHCDDGWTSLVYINGLEARRCGYFATRREAYADGYRAIANWFEGGHFDYLGLNDDNEEK